MTPADRYAFREAVKKLESTGFLMRAANAFGAPIEALIGLLPDATRGAVQEAAGQAIERCLEIVTRSVSRSAAFGSLDGLHKAACTASGALGGFFGVLALPIELPFSTAIILRSIVEIARGEGEVLDHLEARLACMSVFAFGPHRRTDGSADIGYFAVRAALAKAVPNLAERAAPPAFARFVAAIADRFGIVVSEKAVTEAMPVVGAVGGAAINLVFISHFQEIAHGHFTIRRLERKYGEDAVLRAYQEECAGLIC